MEKSRGVLNLPMVSPPSQKLSRRKAKAQRAAAKAASYAPSGPVEFPSVGAKTEAGGMSVPQAVPVQAKTAAKVQVPATAKAPERPDTAKQLDNPVAKPPQVPTPKQALKPAEGPSRGVEQDSKGNFDDLLSRTLALARVNHGEPRSYEDCAQFFETAARLVRTLDPKPRVTPQGETSRQTSRLQSRKTKDGERPRSLSVPGDRGSGEGEARILGGQTPVVGCQETREGALTTTTRGVGELETRGPLPAGRTVRRKKTNLVPISSRPHPGNSSPQVRESRARTYVPSGNGVGTARPQGQGVPRQEGPTPTPSATHNVVHLNPNVVAIKKEEEPFPPA